MQSTCQNSPSINSRRSIMNSLIVFLSVVGGALAQWGHPAGPQETPEVAAARAAHLNALAAAGGHVPAPAAQSWNANPGVPQDTPEVAAAKAAHFAALAQAGSPAQQSGAYNPAPSPYNAAPQQQYNNYAPRWNGPLALPPGFDASGAPLPVQDTPEVQAERAHHLALAARAGAPAPLANQWNAPAANQWNAPAANQWNAPAANQWNAPAANQWNGPAAHSWNNQAAPAYGGYGAAPGAPADTPEVAAAKAAHFAAHQAAIGHRYRRSVLLAAPVAHVTHVAAPIAVAHAAPLHYAHAPILRHAILV